MAECRGLAPLARSHALVSTEARLARPVDIPNWSAWGDLHSQGCSILSRTGLLFPINHTPACRAIARRAKVGRRPGTCTRKARRFLSRRGLLFPLKPVAVKWWAWRVLHPQGYQILSLDPLLFGFNHMPVNWCT